MKRRRAVVLSIVFLSLVVVFLSVFGARKAYAQGFGASTEPVAIPKSYGALKGSDGEMLIFEDSSGTIRLVSIGLNHNPAGQVWRTFLRR
jgi:hypothetical protein